MRSFVIAGVLAAAAGLFTPAAADAQPIRVIGTRGADPYNPYTHGYYSPVPGVLYSPFANAPVAPYTSFYSPAFTPHYGPFNGPVTFGGSAYFGGYPSGFNVGYPAGSGWGYRNRWRR